MVSNKRTPEKRRSKKTKKKSTKKANKRGKGKERKMKQIQTCVEGAGRVLRVQGCCLLVRTVLYPDDGPTEGRHQNTRRKTIR